MSQIFISMKNVIPLYLFCKVETLIRTVLVIKLKSIYYDLTENWFVVVTSAINTNLLNAIIFAYSCYNNK